MDIKAIKRFERLEKTPHWLTGYEDPIWYDGIAFYYDNKGRKYSRDGNPIEANEMCKPWIIYQILPQNEWPGRYDYSYKIISARPDTIRQLEWRDKVKLNIIKRNRNHYHYCNLINNNSQ